MAVPANQAAYLKNTTGGEYPGDTTEGGTILGNSTVGSVITKALALKDNSTDWLQGTLPRVLNDGLSSNQKVFSDGVFAYEEAGKYVIATISDTLSGVSKTNILITGQGNTVNAIHQFEHDFGADTTSLMRKNRFSRVGYFNNGNKVNSRVLWLNAAGTAVATPSTLTGNDPHDPVSGGTARRTDSAANPTRAIPGELVLKVDFVTLTVASGGDFFDYKAITGM
tara:strand:- start:1433 stop:2104 length:672 start_codon:yes stop_codon:yes gene_type:complete